MGSPSLHDHERSSSSPAAGAMSLIPHPGSSPLSAGPSTGAEPGPVNGWLSHDPRTSSTQSLVPSDREAASERRTLLIVYIHGFYGNDQSFRSFPAHVHAFLRNLLVDSHVIHSKIYPRYKTYKAIEIARDNFSAWLQPHESPTTDVILVGHSMGGLLAADVVLMPNQDPYRQQRFKHRILGTISLDSPFLGLHPGIIISGIASLVQPAPKSPGPESPQLNRPSSIDTTQLPHLQSTGSMDSHVTSSSFGTPLSTPPARQNNDPYFDPPFFNDAPFREQPFIKRLVNFASKHKSEGIMKALRSHILSHLEYGGCLADYSGLMERYKKVRALEDVDEVWAVGEGHPAGSHARVRFANYYTLSSGRPKPPKPTTPDVVSPEQSAEFSGAHTGSIDARLQSTQPSSVSKSGMEFSQLVPSKSGVSTSSISVTHNDGDSPPDVAVLDEKLRDVQLDEETDHQRRDSSTSEFGPISMQDIDPIPMEEESPVASPTKPSSTADSELIPEQRQSSDTPAENTPELPPIAIPPEPIPPIFPDISLLYDKESRKIAERETKRLQKVYDQALKERAKALREREKQLAKRRKKADKETEQSRRNVHKEQQRRERESEQETQRLVRQAEAAAKQGETVGNDPSASQPEKPRKQRKFCTLPGKINGEKDKTWIDVYMDGMDEVTAHSGLFLDGPHYEPLVGDVGNRILNWVQEDLTTRAILNLEP